MTPRPDCQPVYASRFFLVWNPLCSFLAAQLTLVALLCGSLSAFVQPQVDSPTFLPLVLKNAREPDIVFSSNRDDFRYDIYTMNSDGTNLINVTQDPIHADDEPAWSPDKEKIVFVSNRDSLVGDIYVMNANGSGIVRVTDHPADDRNPSWSPDGSKIVFASVRDATYNIYRMNADGSEVIRLTTSSEPEGSPDWSPDGQKIVFVSLRQKDVALYVMKADGSEQARLTLGVAPAWSPDSRQILFAANHGGIFVINADGSGLTKLADYGSSPAWSPDGTQIVFASGQSGNSEICLMNSDGSGQVTLTQDPANDIFPDW